jgi:hypothetical protein
LKEKISDIEEKTSALQAEKEKAMETRQDPEREAKLAQLKNLQKVVKEKQELKDRILKCHPDKLAENHTAIATLKAEANFYTGTIENPLTP